MKFVIPLIVAVVLMQMVSAIANAQGVNRDTAELEEKVQFTQTASEYRHGTWCMDSRVF